MRPRLLDLFCGAGGAAMGYHRAGFDVVGVDIAPQPRFPFDFWHEDALELVPEEIGADFDAIHASPPCQAHSDLRTMATAGDHADLIPATRRLLIAAGVPYVIENVEGAPLINPIVLCGSSFGLRLRRHRLFECSFPLMAPPCAHGRFRADVPISRSDHRGVEMSRFVPVYGTGSKVRGNFDLALEKEAMGIDWMRRPELSQAIPPAYTEHIGHYLMAALERKAVA